MSSTEAKNQASHAESADAGTAAISAWEAAYQRFETPEQEIQKFVKRLLKAGSAEWPRDAEIVELFCGRGNGLHALRQLGFSRIEGVDLSPRLIAQYHGDAPCIVGDCRELPFADRSKDVLIVQGGLHHLPVLPDDLDRTLAEMHRVLRPSGRFMMVEPWSTPFLTTVHYLSENPILRRMYDKFDAFATMYEYEHITYDQWRGQPDMIRKLVYSRFAPVRESFSWGKWSFVGKPL